MFFGEKLREMRIKAKMGRHKFKDAMETTLNVVELSDIEHGYAPPPDCGRQMAQFRKALKMSFNDPDWQELIRLREEPFVMQEMPENVVLSPLTHKSDGTRLTEDEFRGLHEHINNIAKEHNEKARNYNETES